MMVVRLLKEYLIGDKTEEEFLNEKVFYQITQSIEFHFLLNEWKNKRVNRHSCQTIVEQRNRCYQSSKSFDMTMQLFIFSRSPEII